MSCEILQERGERGHCRRSRKRKSRLAGAHQTGCRAIGTLCPRDGHYATLDARSGARLFRCPPGSPLFFSSRRGPNSREWLSAIPHPRLVTSHDTRSHHDLHDHDHGDDDEHAARRRRAPARWVCTGGGGASDAFGPFLAPPASTRRSAAQSFSSARSCA